MAGLLDFFATSQEDPRYATNMALFEGIAKGNVPGAMREAQQQAQQKKLSDLKLEELTSMIAERKGKLALAQQTQNRKDRFLNGDPGEGSVPSGQFNPSPEGYGYTAPNFAAAPGAGGLVGRARKMGIPEDAIQADVAFNDGKGIGDMLFKRGAPDMQVTNNFAYDKNRLNPGFMPSLNTSQDGKTSMIQIDPNTGLPIVSAPQGALNTFAGYRNVDESTKANFDPVTVTPQGQSPQMTSRGALMRNPQVQGGQPQAAPQGGGQSVRDAGRVDILNQELTKAQAQLKNALQSGDSAAANRAATDVSALNRELGRSGGGSAASVGMPLQSDAEKTREVGDAKSAAERDANLQKGATNSRDTLTYIREARKLFDKGPTASGIGAAIDIGAGIIGKSTPGADAAAQLDTLSGWMVSNVPRMEGPQSNFDVQNYKTMAGMVGDKTKPLSQRKAALDTLEKLQEKYAHLNGSAGAAPAAPAAPAKPAVGSVRGGYRFKGGNPADQASWEKQ